VGVQNSNNGQDGLVGVQKFIQWSMAASDVQCRARSTVYGTDWWRLVGVQNSACRRLFPLQGTAELEDDSRALLRQIIGLHHGPSDTDAEGGKASPAQLQGSQ